MTVRHGVPNTWAQCQTYRMRGEVVRGMCRCGRGVREGWVRCVGCTNSLARTLSSLSNIDRERVMRHVMSCECGNARAPESGACPTCLWRDDDGGVVMSTLPGTARSVSEHLGMDVRVVRERLRALAIVGRACRDEVTGVWSRLR